MTDSVANIDRLRRIAGSLKRENVDAAWFVAALAQYESGAPLGMSMEAAFGLACSSRGQRPWWALEARRRRDELIRAIDARVAGRELAIRQIDRALTDKVTTLRPTVVERKKPALVDFETITTPTEATQHG